MIVRESFASGGDGVVDTNHVVTAPSGIVAGDVLIVVLGFNGSPVTVTPPAGWVDIGTALGQANPKVRTYRKVSAGGEGPDFTWTSTGAVYSGWVIARYSGVDPTTPEDVVTLGTDGVAALTFDLNGIVTVSAGAMVWAGCAVNSSADRVTENNVLTEVGRAFGANIKDTMLVDGIQAVPGATGVLNFNINLSVAWAGVVGALRPLPSAPGPADSGVPAGGGFNRKRRVVEVRAHSLMDSLQARYGPARGGRIYEEMQALRRGPFARGKKYGRKRR